MGKMKVLDKPSDVGRSEPVHHTRVSHPHDATPRYGILSWNTRGQGKGPRILHWMMDHNIRVICIQECSGLMGIYRKLEPVGAKDDIFLPIVRKEAFNRLWTAVYVEWKTRNSGGNNRCSVGTLVFGEVGETGLVMAESPTHRPLLRVDRCRRKAEIPYVKIRLGPWSSRLKLPFRRFLIEGF